MLRCGQTCRLLYGDLTHSKHFARPISLGNICFSYPKEQLVEDMYNQLKIIFIILLPSEALQFICGMPDPLNSQSAFFPTKFMSSACAASIITWKSICVYLPLRSRIIITSSASSLVKNFKPLLDTINGSQECSAIQMAPMH